MFKEATTMIRDYISQNSEEWEKIIHKPDLEKISLFRELH